MSAPASAGAGRGTAPASETARRRTEGGQPVSRVLHVIQDLQTGGGQKLVLDLLRHMDPGRVRVVVAYLRPDHAMREQYERAGIPTVCLGHEGGATSARTLARLVRLVRTYRPDVMHAHSSLDKHYAQVTGLLCGVPVVNHLHITHDYADETALRARIRGWAAKRVSRYIAVTEAVRQAHAGHVPDPERRLVLVYNGIPVREFGRRDPEEQARVRRELGLEDAFPVLLNVGRLHPQKDQTHLIPMLGRIRERWPKAALLIAGEGPERQALEQRIEAEGLRGPVRLLGDREDVAALLAVCDVFVLSSRSEGFGLVVAEAMAAGKPVVAFDLPVLRELIDNGQTGWLVEPRTPEALASTILHVLAYPQATELVAERGRRVASEKFDIEKCARSIEDVYMAVMAESRRARGRILPDREA